MTSLAFILGVLPMVLSKGAGSGAQNAIGTAVMGGMLSATVLAIFFVPVFFVVVRRAFPAKLKETAGPAAVAEFDQFNKIETRVSSPRRYLKNDAQNATYFFSRTHPYGMRDHGPQIQPPRVSRARPPGRPARPTR